MADFSYEDQYDGDVCGLDEVGRGPLAGPVVAACVVIPKDMRAFDFVDEIKDSKKLSLRRREYLYEKIIEHFPHHIAEVQPDEIDRINILQASLKAMRLAHEALGVKGLALVDGNKDPDLNAEKTMTIVKGDQKSKSIAAASILAKVYRDRIMAELDKKHPHYGWSKNAGYPTKAHREALLGYGVTDYHRRSFGPVKKIIESGQ